MKKICFVCHGNICRSPMAEFILKQLLSQRGRSAEFLVESRATHDDEQVNGVGNPIYPPARRVMDANGVPYEARHSTQLVRADYGRYDLFLCMDDENVETMNRIFGGDPAGKIHKLLVFTRLGVNVADPWFTGDFDTAFREIRSACEALLSVL